MFNKIKKSKVYKGFLIAIPVVAGILCILWFLCFGRLILEIGWGAWMEQGEYVRIESVFEADNSADIDVKSTTVTFVGYNEDEINVEAEMLCTVDVLKETKLSFREHYSIINNAYLDDVEINLDDKSVDINSLGEHKLKFCITYKSYLDVYEDYKAMKVENTIQNSTLVLSNKFKVEQQDDLLKKNEKYKIYDAESTFEFTDKISRTAIYKTASIYSIFALIYLGTMLVFGVVVSIGAKREKKRADENALQESAK